MKRYKGWRTFAPTLLPTGELESQRHTASGVRVVVIEGESERELPLRLDLRSHSPAGFNWSYGGSGPAQLALAILVDCLGESTGCEPALYQRFKRDFVAHWGDEWEVTESTIRDFANETKAVL